MTTQHSKKFFINIYYLRNKFLIIDFSTINNTENDLQISNDYILDEIYPLCNGIPFSITEDLKSSYIEFIQINLVDKEGWYRNFYELSTNQKVLITDKYKGSMESLK